MNRTKTILTVSVCVFLVLSCGKDSDLAQEVLEPTKVSLIFPENNSECTAGDILSDEESRVTFEWSAATLGDEYLVTITDLLTGESREIEAETNQTPILLKRGTPYRWEVTTRLSSPQKSVTSDPAAFYNAGVGVRTHIPFPASNPTPIDGILLQEGLTSVTLQWEASDIDDDLVNFDVYFGTNVNPGLISELQVQPSITVDVNPQTTYYWKVVSRDSQGNESNSQIFSFIVP